MTARITGRTGRSVGSDVFFEAVDDSPIDRARAREEQTRLGYHPDGYGGPCDLRNERLLDGRHRATWSCAGCCD